MINTCPISNVLVDENVVRLNGFFTILILISSFFYFPVLYFLAIDLFIRSVSVKFSPIVFISKTIIHIFKIKPLPIDFAPKKFALRMGFVMNLILIILNLFNYNLFFIIILLFFIIAAIGETFFRFCFGCKIYSLINNIKKK